MKKVFFLLTIPFALLVLPISSLNTPQILVNGMYVEMTSEMPQTISCWIEDENGRAVTDIRVSNPWTNDVKGYWIAYNFAGTYFRKAKFIIVIMNSPGLPIKKIRRVQKWAGSGYAASGSTPLVISDWGGASYGTGKVTMKLYPGPVIRTCTFDILAYAATEK